MTVSQRQVTVPLRLILADSVKVVYDCNCLNDDKLQVGDNSHVNNTNSSNIIIAERIKGI